MGHLAPECGCRKNKMLEMQTIMMDCAQTQAQKTHTYIHATKTQRHETRNGHKTHTHTYTQPWVEAVWPPRCTRSEKQRSLSRACIQVCIFKYGARCMNTCSSRKRRKQLPVCHLRGDMSPFHLQSTLSNEKCVLGIGWKYVVPECRLMHLFKDLQAAHVHHISHLHSYCQSRES